MSYVKSVKLLDENNVAYGVKHVSNKPRNVTTPYYFEIGACNIVAHDPKFILGHDTSTTTTFKDVSELGVALIPVPTSAITMELVSTSVNDIDVTGSGVRKVELHGLDTNWDEQSEIINLNGTTPVSTVNQYLRVNNIHATEVGSHGATATGDITLQSVGGGTVYNIIKIGESKSLEGHFTIPNGKVGYILHWNAGSTGKETQSILRATAHNGVLIPDVFHFLDVITTKDGMANGHILLPIKLPAKTDIKVSARALTTAGGTAECSVQLFYENV